MPLMSDLGLKEEVNKLGFGSFDPKLYRLVKGNAKTENYSILTRVLLKAGPQPTGRDGPAARRPTGRGSALCKTLQTQQQLDLELPQSLAGDSDSELNNECTIHSRLTLNKCYRNHSTERLLNNQNGEVVSHFDRNCAAFVFLLLFYFVQR